MLVEFDVISTGSNQKLFQRHSEIVQDVMLRIAFDDSYVPMIYLCAVALVFIIPEDETAYNEFQRRGIYADIDFPVDCRSIIIEYFDIIGRGNFLLYHSPYSLLAAVSRYVVLHHGSVSTPPHHYQAFRDSSLHFKLNPCYAINMTSAHHSVSGRYSGRRCAYPSARRRKAI